MKKNVMLVDDDEEVREGFTQSLENAGFVVKGYSDIRTSLEAAKESLPDLALLEINLNQERDAGFQLCCELRVLSKRLPILFLTTHNNDVDKISAIRVGADDYIDKGVNTDYLVIRMEALLRRYAELADTERQPDTTASVTRVSGQVTVDREKLNIYWQNQKVDLRLPQIKMVDALLECEGQVSTYTKLMQAANICVEPNTITAHICAIRNRFKAIDPGFNRIVSARGIGYRWLAD